MAPTALTSHDAPGACTCGPIRNGTCPWQSRRPTAADETGHNTLHIMKGDTIEMDDRTRTVGDVTAVFRTEQDAKDFDWWMNSTITITYNGKEVDRFKVGDRFYPLKDFGVDLTSTPPDEA